MSKRIIVSLIAAVALAVSALASTAGATITITQAQAGPGYQNLSPHTCGGRTFYLTAHQGTDANGNPIQVPGSGLPIRLSFGWGANTDSQMRQFFKYSHGSVSITGSDSFSDSWANSPSGDPFVSQQGIVWDLTPQTLTPPGNSSQTVQGFSSNYRGVLSLAPGTYTLSQSFVFDRPVQDGFASYRGSLTSTCTFTVAA